MSQKSQLHARYKRRLQFSHRYIPTIQPRIANRIHGALKIYATTREMSSSLDHYFIVNNKSLRN